MATAISVADQFLKLAKKNNTPMTPLKLMKLVYIAHGWSLGVRDVDLFTDKIEAWKFGPVIPALYHATKKFGRSIIPLDLVTDAPSGLTEDEKKFVEDVYSKYGSLTGVSLSNLTHQSGTPWDTVYVEGVFNIEIPDSLIKQHYKAKANEKQIRTTTPA